MNVIVLCEFSGIVRDAFVEYGHRAVSLDILPTERKGGRHIRANLWDFVQYGSLDSYDLAIAHPPCTYLAVSGARWFKQKMKEQESAIAFFRMILHLPVPRICIENPISVISSKVIKPDQIIEPWQFGHAEKKRTCLWLKGLPLLKPTRHKRGFCRPRVHYIGPSTQRWKERSRTYIGIADAFAQQWGSL